MASRHLADKACAHMQMGSIADNGSGGSYAYRSSKVALNQVTKSLSIDLEDQGITCVLLHPGWRFQLTVLQYPCKSLSLTLDGAFLLLIVESVGGFLCDASLKTSQEVTMLWALKEYLA